MVLDLSRILIIGAGGQDGSILREALDNQNNHLVLAFNRLPSLFAQINEEKNTRMVMDIRSKEQVFDSIRTYKPEVIYNLASPGGVGYSYQNPRESFDVNCIGTLNILDAIVAQKMQDQTYLFQASSGEVFGEVDNHGHTEASAIRPVSPYGTAKAASLMACDNYRSIYGVRVGVGIMFNHESERRENSYVTRKIVKGLVKWSRGIHEIIELGNVDITRDWILASDAMAAACAISTDLINENFVIARGSGHSIRQFIEISMSILAIKESFDTIFNINPKFMRPNEIISTYGNSKKLQERTSWKPTGSFEDMVEHLIKLELLAQIQ